MVLIGPFARHTVEHEIRHATCFVAGRRSCENVLQQHLKYGALSVTLNCQTMQGSRRCSARPYAKGISDRRNRRTRVCIARGRGPASSQRSSCEVRPSHEGEQVRGVRGCRLRNYRYREVEILYSNVKVASKGVLLHHYLVRLSPCALALGTAVPSGELLAFTAPRQTEEGVLTQTSKRSNATCSLSV